MPQSLPVVIHHSASLPALVRTFRTSPDLPPDSVPTQPPYPQNFRTKSTGGGGPLPLPHSPHASPLPLSAVFVDNKEGCAWPDRTSFRKKIQDGQQGPKALCRGVSGGWASWLPFPKQAACQPRWLANSEVRRITQCAKSSPCNAPPARTGTTPPRRTRRRPPAASSSQSSAIPAASTRHTKRRSNEQPLAVGF
jgi:hypothetical protein